MKIKVYPVLFAVMALPSLLSAQLAVSFSADNTSGCKPFKIKFIDQTIPPGSDVVTQWQWDFGDGGSSSQANPTHIYTQDGSYTVKLVAITNTGTKDSLVRTSYIHTGNFLSVNLGNDTVVCPGGSITLNAGNTGVQYLWNTGAATQTISASQPGQYWVQISDNACTASDTINVAAWGVNLGNDTAICGSTTITLNGGGIGDTWQWSNGATTSTIAAGTGTWWVAVTKNGCSVKDTISIGSVAPLSAQISYMVKTACLPVMVQFTDVSTYCPGNTINQWLWNFGDGTTSTLQNPLHSYTKTGSFSVKLTVTTITGLTNTRSKSIFITNGTAPVVNLGNDSTVCPGAGLVLNAGNSGAVYTWNTSATSQTITVNKTGTYSVIVDKNGCVGKDTVQVTVKTSPVVHLGNDTSICTGSVLQLDAGNPAALFSWSTGEATQKINVSAAGTYWAKADEGGCSSADTILITTQSPVSPALGYTIGFKCLPVAVDFSDNSIVRCGAISQWHWDFGDGTSSDQRNPRHSYVKADTFHVQLTLTTSQGLIVSAASTINIENIPPAISPASDVIACLGSPVQLAAGIDNAVYRWTPAAGLNNDTIENPVFTPGAATLYHVEVTKCLVTQQRNIFVSVDSISPPVITQDDTTLVSSPAPFYQWYKNGFALGGDTQGTLYPEGYGTYTVKVFHPNGCSALSVPFVYKPGGNSNNRLKGVYVALGPNPTHGLITISMSPIPVGGMVLRCIDSRGRYIFSQVIRNSFNRVDLGRYPKGEYFITLEYKGEQLTIPVSVQ